MHAAFDLYLYIDGVPTVGSISDALQEFTSQWDGQMGWWVTDRQDRGSGVRIGLLVEPNVAPVADRLAHPAMAGVVVSTDAGRTDKDFVGQLNIVAALMGAFGGTVYDPQQDALFTTLDELNEYTRTKVVQFFNEGERFQREIEESAETRASLGGNTLWQPDDEAMEEIVRENRGVMAVALVSLAFLCLFVVMAVQKSCS